ncbi:MAG: hypothetical protein M0Z45_11345 [Actinomycetota bacterium]|nr:hypothetical protein [Actinomycetota bacterium]
MSTRHSVFRYWGGVKSFDPKAGTFEVLSKFMIAFSLFGAFAALIIASLVTLLGVPDNVGLVIGILIFGASLLFGGATYGQSGGDESGAFSLVEIVPEKQPRINSLVEGISASIGLERPQVSMVDTSSINAISIIGPKRQPIFVLTRGAVTLLTRMELEALVARELVRIRSGQVQIEARFRSYRRLVGRFIKSAIPQTFSEEMLGRDLARDIGAITVTRFPPAMVDLLEKVANQSSLSDANLPSSVFSEYYLVPNFADVSVDERTVELRKF